VANGGDIFASTCANCHGPNGNDGSAPDLTVQVPAQSDEELRTIISDGQGYMPAQDITGTDLDDTLAYLRMQFPAR
jgi:mono/diheme cytochrome c family protein